MPSRTSGRGYEDLALQASFTIAWKQQFLGNEGTTQTGLSLITNNNVCRKFTPESWMANDFATANNATITPVIPVARTRYRADAIDDGEKPIRLNELMSRCMNKPSFVKTLLEEFELSVATLVTAASGTIAEGECERAAEALHALKGATATVSAAAFYQLAVVAETLAREGDIDSLQSVMPNLCRESVACLAYITEIKTVL